MMRVILRAMGVSVLLSSTAWAQGAEEPATDEAPADEAATDEGTPFVADSEEDAAEEPAAAEEAPAAVAPAGAAPADASTSEGGGDGTRFRFGVALGGGLLSVSDDFDNSASGAYYGLDLRFGAQINDMIGVYAVPQLGGYSLEVGPFTGFGGLVGASAVVDFTFVDRIFVGAGPGFAILNSPSGAELHFRAGGYPIVSRSSEKIRRKALMLGVDFRVHFVEGVTGIAPTFNIGYESF